MTPTLDRRHFLGLVGAAVAGPRFAPAADPPSRGMVTGQADGARAGLAVLEAGGNAVDAVVAAALVAGVVAVPSTGIGGYGGHLVLAKPGGGVFALDFNTTAPAAARPETFAKNREAANHGWLAAGVPGVLAGLQLALDRFGTRKFADLVQPAVRLARDGFPVTRGLARAIRNARKQFVRDPGSAKLFLANGEPPAEGATFRNPGLAAMLEALATAGRVDGFYRGPIADRIAAAFQKNGGLVTAADLAAYRAREVEPLSLDWRGHTISTPPPTSGGLTVLEALAVLKAAGYEKLDPKNPATVQMRVEALRGAWADRLALLGDPEHADVPVGRLLSMEYVGERADRVRAAVRDGKPLPAAGERRPHDGTIHLTATDAAGMMVALTYTHGNSFGAQVTADGLGLVLGHGMSRFDLEPGRPNSIGPGKRPLHNMCPTVVTRGGKPVLALGATGGRRIPNTVFDVLAYRVGEGRPLAEAVKAPRVHTEGDLALTLEAAWPAAAVVRFRKAGYTVRTGGAANLNAIERDPATGDLRPAAR